MTQTLGGASPSQYHRDAAHFEQTLNHEPTQLGLDDSASLRGVALLYIRGCLAWFLAFTALDVIGTITTASSKVSAAVIALAVLTSTVIFWVVLLGGKVTEPVGEWRVLLPGRSESAESHYRMVVAELSRRQLPVGLVLRRIQLDTRGRPVKHTITVREGDYQAYVTVFAYGTSLYVGWQMWRRRSGLRLIRRALSDRAYASDPVAVMLRTDRARALREAVHLACREAVFAPPDQKLFAQAQALQLPQVEVEQESALLQPMSTSPPIPQPPTLSQPPQVNPPPPHPTQGSARDELTIAVSIFLSDEGGHDSVEAAVEDLLTEQGFEVVYRSTAEAGR